MTDIRKKFFDARSMANNLMTDMVKGCVGEPEDMEVAQKFMGIVDIYNGLFDSMTREIDMLVDMNNMLYKKVKEVENAEFTLTRVK